MDIIKRIEYHKGETERFIKTISYGGDYYNLFNKGFLFRGHSFSDYKLQPSALRKKGMIGTDLIKSDKSIKMYGELLQIYRESQLLQQFYKNCDDTGLYIPFIDEKNIYYLLNEDRIASTFPPFEYWPPKDYYELMSLAQHYGIPTRLLDWSRDVNVAIYFALSDYLNGKEIIDNEYMTLWAMDGGSLELESKPLPLKIIKPRYHNNPNLHAQKGVFSVWSVSKKDIMDPSPTQDNSIRIIEKEVNDKPLDELLKEYIEEHRELFKDITYLYRFDFYDIKYQIPFLYNYLEKQKSTAQYIFPGYDGVTRYIKERIVINDLMEDIYYGNKDTSNKE